MISYRIDATDVRAHLYRVTLTVPAPQAEQRLSLPVWIPGSYLVREFARHLFGLAASQDGRAVPLRQVDKATWIATTDSRSALTVSYAVYAFDTSVRAAYLDSERGFFNGTSLLLRVHGAEAGRHRLALHDVPDGWRVATAMDAIEVDAAGRGVYEAADYDELVDHPVELGRFWHGRFEAAGVPHEFVVAGAWPDFDGKRLLADAARICEAQIAFWHGQGPDAGRAPFTRYLFLLNAVEDGHGGLEHRASTALIAPRRDLPRRDATGDRAPAAEPARASSADGASGTDAATGTDADGAAKAGQAGSTAAAVDPASKAAARDPKAELSDGYVGLLGLISHEYFHAWNVKRLRPDAFARYDYERENYTELLWFFEGFTSYYDDLFLRRAGLVDDARYLKLLARTIGNVAMTPGRLVQSVAEASFDAWVKYYRNDENTPNATISYYAKGSLVALALDLTLRGSGRGTLDEVMRRLWSRTSGGPMAEADVLAALETVGGRSYAAEIAAWVHGREDLPLRSLLEAAGVEWQPSAPATVAQRLGVRVAESAFTGVKVTHVLRGGAGEQAGLSAGDEIIALQGWRLRRLDDASRLAEPGVAAPLLVARDQRILTLALMLPADEPAAGGVTLKPAARAAPGTLARCQAWLDG